MDFLPPRAAGGFVLLAWVLFAAFGWVAFRPRRSLQAPRSRLASGLGIGVLAVISFVCACIFCGIVFNGYPHDLVDSISAFMPESMALRLPLSVAGALGIVIGYPFAAIMLFFVVLYGLWTPIRAIRRRIGQEPGPYKDLAWPESGLGALLPPAPEKQGRIDQDSATIFRAEVDGVEPGAFEFYCERCLERGFVLEGFTPPDGHGWSNPEKERRQKMTPVRYSGRNAEGFRLDLVLNAEFIEVMTITLQKDEAATEGIDSASFYATLCIDKECNQGLYVLFGDGHLG